MSIKHKIFSINSANQLVIKRISIEQAFGQKEISVNITTIPVLQAQVLIEVKSIPNERLPELIEKPQYLTQGGVFDNESLSGIHIAEDEDDTSSIELNFLCTEGSDEGCLIPADFRYAKGQEFCNHHLSKISDFLAPNRYPIQLHLGEILHHMQVTLGEMTGNNPFECEGE